MTMSSRALPTQLEFTVGLDDPAADIRAPEHERCLIQEVARRLKIPEAELPPVALKKRAVDARRGRVAFHLTVGLGQVAEHELGQPAVHECNGPSRVVIVGDGPAGLFCAYQLARSGVACTVIDRGKQVQPRRRDLKLLNARGGVDPDSNYCFGEGGAGTYSDGKLYTRSHKRGPVRDVMELLAVYGAPTSILTEARPHIGSNLLPEIISRIRQRLEQAGISFLFETRLTDIVTQGKGSDRRVTGVRCERVGSGETLELGAEAVVLATGHSARDVFDLGNRLGLLLEPKGFALGVRIEHPQQLINQIQFGKFAGHPKLGAASYKVAAQVEGKGVYSFCMCPGGWIVPAMTDAEHLVVNGMSLSKRDSAFANSGFVVGVETADYQACGFEGPLGGVRFQAHVERAAQEAGGGQNRAPAVRVSDFLDGKVSSTLPDTSYLPGLVSSDLVPVLDSAGVLLSGRIKEALRYFGRRMRGFDSSEAILVGVETRTSAPLRMVRDPDTFMTPGLFGLFLAGEGPGYAGGIVSAAVDGMRAADLIIAHAQLGDRRAALR